MTIDSDEMCIRGSLIELCFPSSTCFPAVFLLPPCTLIAAAFRPQISNPGNKKMTRKRDLAILPATEKKLHLRSRNNMEAHMAKSRSPSGTTTSSTSHLLTTLPRDILLSLLGTYFHPHDLWKMATVSKPLLKLIRETRFHKTILDMSCDLPPFDFPPPTVATTTVSFGPMLSTRHQVRLV